MRYHPEMRFAVLFAATLLFGVGLASAASERAARLTMRDSAPLTVRGAGFLAGEQVRVIARTPAVSTRTVRARTDGTFVVSFRGAIVDRCSVTRVTARGSSGSTAGLKLLPSPMCPPA
jgi:hypothetical protein